MPKTATCWLYRQPSKPLRFSKKKPAPLDGLGIEETVEEGPTLDAAVHEWIRRMGYDQDNLRRTSAASFKKNLRVTLMHEAAQQGSVRLCQWLAERGCVDDIGDRENASGSSPLFLACWHGHVNVLVWLSARGADPRQPDAKGWTPLLYCAWKGHLRAMKWLAQNGAADDVSTRALDGLTPLYYASLGGRSDCVKWLLENGASPDLIAETQWGGRPLHAAAMENHIAIVKELIGSGGGNGKEGHVDKAVLEQCHVLDRAPEGVGEVEGATEGGRGGEVQRHLVAWLDEVKRDRDRFVHCFLPATTSSGAGEGRECSALVRVDTDALQHIADFAGVCYGRRLRNVREASECCAREQ